MRRLFLALGLALLFPSLGYSQPRAPAGGVTIGGKRYEGGQFIPKGSGGMYGGGGDAGPLVTYDPEQALANKQAYTSAMAKARAKRAAATRKLSDQRASAVRDMGKAADTAVRMAKIFERTGKMDAAIEQYRKAVEASPESTHGQEAAARLQYLGMAVPEPAPTQVASAPVARPTPAPSPETVLLERKVRQSLNGTKLVETPYFVRHAKTCDLPIDDAKVVSVSLVPKEAQTCKKCGGGASR